MYKENRINLFRLTTKTNQEVDYFIITWLIEFLKENLTTQEINHIDDIQNNITLAMEEVEGEEVKSTLPDWDLEKV